MRVEGNYLKYLNSGCNRKQQRRNKDFKIGGQAGSRGRCLKRGGGGGWNPLKNYVYVFMHIVCTYVCICVSYLYHIYIYMYTCNKC